MNYSHLDDFALNSYLHRDVTWVMLHQIPKKILLTFQKMPRVQGVGAGSHI